MGRDRSSTNDLQRDETPLPTKKRYHLICEGKTEYDYFKNLQSEKLLKDGIFIEEIAKDGVQRDQTNRLIMVEMADDHKLFYSSGVNTIRRVVITIFNSYIEPLNLNGEGKKFYVDKAEEFIRDLKKTYSNNIEKGQIPKIIEDISERISKMDHMEYDFTKTDELFTDPKGWDENDSICVIFDRDYDKRYFPDEVYNEVLEKCKNKGYHPIVSNPLFEFWMLLHLVDKINKIGKPDKGHGYAHWVCERVNELENISGDKSIGEKRFNRSYRNNIMNAIRLSKDKSLKTDPKSLMSRPGTNVGKFVEEIIKS